MILIYVLINLCIMPQRTKNTKLSLLGRNVEEPRKNTGCGKKYF